MATRRSIPAEGGEPELTLAQAAEALGKNFGTAYARLAELYGSEKVKTIPSREDFAAKITDLFDRASGRPESAERVAVPILKNFEAIASKYQSVVPSHAELVRTSLAGVLSTTSSPLSLPETEEEFSRDVWKEVQRTVLGPMIAQWEDKNAPFRKPSVDSWTFTQMEKLVVGYGLDSTFTNSFSNFGNRMIQYVTLLFKKDKWYTTKKGVAARVAKTAAAKRSIDKTIRDFADSVYQDRTSPARAEVAEEPPAEIAENTAEDITNSSAGTGREESPAETDERDDFCAWIQEGDDPAESFDIGGLMPASLSRGKAYYILSEFWKGRPHGLFDLARDSFNSELLHVVNQFVPAPERAQFHRAFADDIDDPDLESLLTHLASYVRASAEPEVTEEVAEEAIADEPAEEVAEDALIDEPASEEAAAAAEPIAVAEQATKKKEEKIAFVAMPAVAKGEKLETLYASGNVHEDTAWALGELLGVKPPVVPKVVSKAADKAVDVAKKVADTVDAPKAPDKKHEEPKEEKKEDKPH